MTRDTALFLTNLDTGDDVIRAAAQASATAQTHLAVLIHTVTPTLPINAMGALPYSGPAPLSDWDTEVSQARTDLKARCKAVNDILARADCAGDTRPYMTADADIQDAVAQAARTADTAFIAPNLRDDGGVFRAMVHGLLFHSPIGVVLNAGPGLAPRHVMVAWDDSPPAARAVHMALPMLKAAGEVTVACFDPSPLSDGQPYEPGAALSAWLGHHGCKVTVAQFATGGGEIASALTARAAELGADLIVAGAYARSRMRQAVFGGTTRRLMDQSDHPILLAH
ncbi:MAG: universal stress protein [Pseudomonadota bacterium]